MPRGPGTCTTVLGIGTGRVSSPLVGPAVNLSVLHPGRKGRPTDRPTVFVVFEKYFTTLFPVQGLPCTPTTTSSPKFGASVGRVRPRTRREGFLGSGAHGGSPVVVSLLDRWGRDLRPRTSHDFLTPKRVSPFGQQSA